MFSGGLAGCWSFVTPGSVQGFSDCYSHLLVYLGKLCCRALTSESNEQSCQYGLATVVGGLLSLSSYVLTTPNLA